MGVHTLHAHSSSVGPAFGYNVISFYRRVFGPVTFFQEYLVSRVINPDSAGKERTRLIKAIVVALRELARQSQPTQDARDLAAFIALALASIAAGVDASVIAWEKRDYWLKADRFRRDWMWTETMAQKMKQAILADDWGTIAMLLPQIAQKLHHVRVSENHRLGRPWEGAYQKLKGEPA